MVNLNAVVTPGGLQSFCETIARVRPLVAEYDAACRAGSAA